MTRSYLATLTAGTILTFAAAPAAVGQGSLNGHWLTQDTRAIVEVAPCGQQECGKIVWIKDPIDPANGKPRHDKHNPDAALQRRPIIGLATLSSIQPNADGSWDAHSYDPRDGGDHDITIRLMANGGKMELKGCVLFICRSEIWTKAPDQLPANQTQQQTSN